MLCERTASTNGWEVALGEVVLVGPHCEREEGFEVSRIVYHCHCVF